MIAGIFYLLSLFAARSTGQVFAAIRDLRQDESDKDMEVNYTIAYAYCYSTSVELTCGQPLDMYDHYVIFYLLSVCTCALLACTCV